MAEQYYEEVAAHQKSILEHQQTIFDIQALISIDQQEATRAANKEVARREAARKNRAEALMYWEPSGLPGGPKESDPSEVYVGLV